MQESERLDIIGGWLRWWYHRGGAGRGNQLAGNGAHTDCNNTMRQCYKHLSQDGLEEPILYSH